MKRRHLRLFILIILVITFCAIWTIIPKIEFTNVKDNENTLIEEYFDREYIDTSKYNKKKLSSVTIIDNIVYENATKKDKLSKALVRIVQGVSNIKIKDLPKNIKNYEEMEVNELSINKKFKDERSK